jgi:16S rRNA (guanine1207-N2)-methyltransferase
VLDLGCGAGHLGLAALARWPGARAWLVDADARAVAAAGAALAGRTAGGAAPAAIVVWWDIGEPLPATGFDLVLCNPPCHAGSAVDLEVARAMFRIADGALVPGGRLLVVANRQLPYEADLAALGRVAVVEQAGGFKVLALVRD